jgi:enoyl-CoA hydratase/carnithine racemase
MTMQHFPQLSKAGAKAVIRLNRPEHHNRIDPEDIPVIHAQLDEIERDDSISMLVFTGTGNKTFSSGYTLDAILTRMDDSFQLMLGRIESFQKPTVCALNGSVYGGGVDLASCCDFRIGVHGSRMFVPAAKFGLHYHPDGIRRFVQRVGPVAAKKIFMLGKTMHAQEMLNVGFLTDLVAPDELEAAVDDYLDSVLAGESSVIASIKQNIDAFANGRWEHDNWVDQYHCTLQSDVIRQRLAKLVVSGAVSKSS